MKGKSIFWKIACAVALGIVLFLTGFIANDYIHLVNGSVSGASEIKQEASLFDLSETKERFSPADHITEDKIHVYKDSINIDVEGASWGTFFDTNSMDPVLDSGHNSLEIKPKDFKEVNAGDIIVYEHEEYGYIIHRVIETGFDSDGWYCIAKGDNNPKEDPWKIRFEQIEGIVIGIIYCFYRK